MAYITLGQLAHEGALTLGDTLHHSENGAYEFLGATECGALIVLNQATREREHWRLDFGQNAKLIPKPN